MRRDVLFLREMLSAGTRVVDLVQAVTAEELQGDKDRRESVLWNFTVLGEASSQVSDEILGDFAVLT